MLTMPKPRRRILITGASSGLGAGMARLFAVEGRDLALVARREDRLEALAAELRAAHPEITVVTAALDVTEHDRVFAVFGECAERLGGLDRVIVNAGISGGTAVGGGGFPSNLRIVMTNFVGALAQCEAAMSLFHRAGAGHLVVVSSVSAMRGMPGSMTTYAASKAGLSALAEGIRADAYGTRISVTTLHPGCIRSEMTEAPAGCRSWWTLGPGAGRWWRPSSARRWRRRTGVALAAPRLRPPPRPCLGPPPPAVNQGSLRHHGTVVKRCSPWRASRGERAATTVPW